ncbi:hypothetical protein NLI96_g3098 [Meripilus lineatus]|uniref:Peptidase M12A domain-containing protein n=1 Tax=Meripilus lineatus TaxID=2056292 RepID=A0AAD5YGX2_9APHY|nr:hypothetical protein NLI96_g3098 [Physisporinus lineatus]
MNIQGISSTSSRLSNTERMAILHESGHALGFLHEHQSPARSGKLTFNEFVYEYFRIMEGWSDKVTRDNVTQVVEEREIDNYTEFDTKSIMMYDIPASCNHQGSTIEPNSELSEVDKAFAMVHYPRFTPHEKAPEWTIAHALDVLGVHGTTRDKILQSYCPKEIYGLFTAWNRERITSCMDTETQSSSAQMHPTNDCDALQRWYVPTTL